MMDLNSVDVNANIFPTCAILDDGHLKVVRDLLKRPTVTFNATNAIGGTALICASDFGH